MNTNRSKSNIFQINDTGKKYRLYKCPHCDSIFAVAWELKQAANEKIACNHCGHIDHHYNFIRKYE